MKRYLGSRYFVRLESNNSTVCAIVTSTNHSITPRLLSAIQDSFQEDVKVMDISKVS